MTPGCPASGAGLGHHAIPRPLSHMQMGTALGRHWRASFTRRAAACTAMMSLSTSPPPPPLVVAGVVTGGGLLSAYSAQVSLVTLRCPVSSPHLQLSKVPWKPLLEFPVAGPSLALELHCTQLSSWLQHSAGTASEPTSPSPVQPQSGSGP